MSSVAKNVAYPKERTKNAAAVPSKPIKVMLGGLPIAVATRIDAALHLLDSAQAKPEGSRPLYITSANGQVLAMCASQPEVKQLFLAADIIHADGQPMVVASRRYCKTPLPERVATTDLVHDTARLAEQQGGSFYFFGAKEDVNARAVARMSELYPKLKIAGRRNGYFKPEEEDAVVVEINAAKPDILWVCLGVPLEQQFICRNLSKLTNVGVIKTSGGLLDFLAGVNKRAPKWMQDYSLEWLYRTWLEPRRLGPRYLQTNFQAARLLATKSGDI